MDLKKLQQQLNSQTISDQHLSHWDPPYCGELPLLIDHQGQWLYQNTPIQRPALVKLFASVLVYEQENYFLKTPVEKVKIQVADKPFFIIHWTQQSIKQFAIPTIVMETNVNQKVLLSKQSSLLFDYNTAQEYCPYVPLNRGLSARIHRNVWYQWVEQLIQFDEQKDCWYLASGDHHCYLPEPP